MKYIVLFLASLGISYPALAFTIDCAAEDSQRILLTNNGLQVYLTDDQYNLLDKPSLDIAADLECLVKDDNPFIFSCHGRYKSKRRYLYVEGKVLTDYHSKYHIVTSTDEDFKKITRTWSEEDRFVSPIYEESPHCVYQN